MTTGLSVSAVLFLTDQDEQSNGDFLTRQNWDGAQLVVYGTEQQVVRFKEQYSPEIAAIPILFITQKKDYGAALLEGAYTVFVQPFEYWNDNCVETTVAFVRRMEAQPLVLYQVGFIIKQDHTVLFAQEAMPDLRRPFALDTLFDTAIWFAPFIKMMYRTDILREYRIFPDISSESSPLVAAQLCMIDYMAAVYEQSAFSAPRSEYIPGAFVVPMELSIDKKTLFVLREHLMAKHSIWRKNPWQPVYWKHLWYSRYYKDTFHEKY
jgi:hypothetical protein